MSEHDGPVQPPQRGGTGVWLETAPLLGAWRDRMHAGTPPAIEWFLHLEAVSQERALSADRSPVTATDLARAVGASKNVVDEGTIFTAHDLLMQALDRGGDDQVKPATARTRLYQQARMATFLQYRDGFVASLAAIPFSAEAAIHGYLRVVVEWARRWPGLTVADTPERAVAVAPYEAAMRRGRHRDRFLRTTRFALPLIVEQDLAELFRLAHVESTDVGSTRTDAVGNELALLMMLDHLRCTVSHVVEDETLATLTATNLVRLQTNVMLGGALLRLRVRASDALLLEKRIVTEVRRWLLDPRTTGVPSWEATLQLAQLEQQFASLSVVRRVFSQEGTDD